MTIIILLLVLAVLLFIDYFIAEEYRKIAAQKGYCGRKYFWWCFFTGFIGYGMVIALPDRPRSPQREKTTY